MFKLCLNTSTLRGYNLGLRELIDTTARAGYDAIEPWISDLQAHEESGAKLEDAARQARDAGLSVQGAIGFFEWIVDDDARRKSALEQARRDMELVARFGGSLIAAPPWGAIETTNINLFAAAERYAALCDIGREAGVRPLVEVWGFSKTLSRLGEAAFIATESGHEDATILADVYHLYKGGSPFSGLAMLNPSKMPLFHINDYPSGVAPADIQDEDRVWPGDGVAPLREIFATLKSLGFDGFLSLELFNADYWKGDALETARLGRQKTLQVLGVA